MSMAATASEQREQVQEQRFGFWRRSYAMVVKEFIQLRRDRVSFAMIVMIPVMQLLLFGYAINTTPHNLPTAVLLQEDTDLGRSILKALENTAYFRFTREVHDRPGVRRSPASRARCCSASRSRAASSGRCAAATSRRCWLPPTPPIPSRRRPRSARFGRGADRARARSLHRRSAVAAVRDQGACPLQSRGVFAAQHRAGPGRHHPDHDHADLHRAVGDARDRARHDGEPAVDADQAGRGDVRQDHPLRAGRLHPGRADPRHRRARCSACRCSAAWRCWRCSRHYSSPPISRSATPSRPSCRTSSRRCRCR